MGRKNKIKEASEIREINGKIDKIYKVASFLTGGKRCYQEIKALERKALAEGSSACQIIVGQHWRFVICDWLDLICHMYLCPLAEHRGWGLPLACLCIRSIIYI